MRDETICLNSLVNGKQPSLTDRIYWGGGVIGTVTTMVTKDLLIIEIYERDNPDREDMEK